MAARRFFAGPDKVLQTREARRKKGVPAARPIKVDRPLLTTREAMAYLGFRSPNRIYDLVRNERLPIIRLAARTLRFDPSDLDEWVDARRCKYPATLSAVGE